MLWRDFLGNDQLLGTLDLLILKMLARGPLHGYGLAQRIQQISDEVLRVEEGSLYPALHRMEQLDWICAEWKVTENGRRAKYYKLTALGRKQLTREEKEWSRVAGAVSKILRYA
jgi:PadR family transcriptional regulator, regulatory protein PadR